MATTIIARNRSNDETYEFRTGDVEVAAARLGRRLNIQMVRVTGTRGLSGVFQGYRSDRRAGGLNSYGPQYHIG